MTDAQKKFKAEKAGGNYGAGTKEMQAFNYEKRKQQEKEREQLFESALGKFNSKDMEGVRAPRCPAAIRPANPSLRTPPASLCTSVARFPLFALDPLQALIEFENVLALEPKNYVGDNFSRITQIYRVTQYNIACCYAAMGSVSPSSLPLTIATCTWHAVTFSSWWFRSELSWDTYDRLPCLPHTCA